MPALADRCPDVQQAPDIIHPRSHGLVEDDWPFALLQGILKELLDLFLDHVLIQRLPILRCDQ